MSHTIDTEDYWKRIAEQFEIPADTIYLNNGSFGPCPRPVIEGVVSYLRQLESNPGVYIGKHNRSVQEVKKKFGAFFDIKPEDFVFITNVTVGMNMISRGLTDLSEGDEILTTDQEYGAVNNAWEYMAIKKGLTVRKVALPVPPDSEEQIVAAFSEAITERTRVLYFSHITSMTGLILPVKKIAALARERGIVTAIDGAHAPGMIPVDVEDLGCDFYTGNCHKWLCSPKGVGFLYARPEMQSRLEPFIVGWGWKRDGAGFLGNFENPGTHNASLYMAVGEAVDFQAAIGKDRVAARGRELALYARKALIALPPIKPMIPEDERMACSMAAYSTDPLPEGIFVEALKRQGIHMPSWVGPEGGRFRLSTHVYNNREQVDKLVAAVTEAYSL